MIFSGRIAAIRNDIRSPLFRNAYALMLNSGITAVLGLAYWIVAAQLYEVDEIGQGSGLVTAMTLISSITQANFIQVLIRFLPRAGTQTQRLVLRAYEIASTLAILVAGGVVLVATGIADQDDLLRLSLPMGIWFVIATMSWSIFSLQDAVLIGLRRTLWIPLENGIFGIVKLLTLVAFVSYGDGHGLFLSWTIPVAISILPINFFIFRYFIRKHRAQTADREQAVDAKTIRRFIAGDYVGNISAQLSMTLLPLLVIATLGSTANGFFYPALMLATALDFAAISLAASLTVEASDDEDRIADLAKATLRRTLVIIVPAALLLAASAPLVLHIYGSEYAEESTSLLRLLAFASVPKAVMAVYASLCRVRHHTHIAGLLQFAQAVLLIGLSLALMPHFDIAGAGLAALISQLTIALFAVPALLKAIRHHRSTSASPPELEGETETEAESEETTPGVVDTVHQTATRRQLPWRTIVGMAIPALVVLLCLFVTKDTDARNSGALGLIQALPLSYFAIVGVLAVSFVLFLRAQASWKVLGAHLIALIFLLHGIVSYIEQNPRFPTAYTHIGFVEYILRHNAAKSKIEARLGWPGFFAGGALLGGIAGVRTFDLLLWAPLLMNIAYAILVWSIARSASDDRRVPWLATWLFVTVSWVGQDYFAPQALNLLFFLVFIAVLLRIFRTDSTPMIRGLEQLRKLTVKITSKILRTPPLHSGGSANLELGAAERALTVAMLLVIYSAIIVSHQLTPFFLLLSVGILALASRTELRGFPLLLAVGVFTWISYGAVAFWSSHLHQIFGGAGDVTGTVSKNVGERTQAVHSNHVLVIYGRLALAATLWFGAIFGILRRLRKGRTDFSIVVCCFAPFLILGGQSYGGEAILRVFLFSLPFAATLCVLALLPAENRFTIFKTVLTCLIAVALIPAFMLTRYGNERFEYISEDEYLAVQQLYRIAPVASTIAAFDTNTALQIRTKDLYDRRPVLKELNVDYIYQETTHRADNDSFILLTRAQVESVSLNKGYPRSWGDDLTNQMIASEKFRVVYENPDARIFQVVKPQQ